MTCLLQRRCSCFCTRQALVSNLATPEWRPPTASSGGAEHIEAVDVPSWESDHVKPPSRGQPLGLHYDKESAEVSLSSGLRTAAPKERAVEEGS